MLRMKLRDTLGHKKRGGRLNKPADDLSGIAGGCCDIDDTHCSSFGISSSQNSRLSLRGLALADTARAKCPGPSGREPSDFNACVNIPFRL